MLCHYYAQHKSCGFIHVWNERRGGPDPLDPPPPKSASALYNTFIMYYNTTSAVYARLSVNRDMVKHFEALGLLTTPVMFMLYQPTSQLLH